MIAFGIVAAMNNWCFYFTGVRFNSTITFSEVSWWLNVWNNSREKGTSQYRYHALPVIPIIMIRRSHDNLVVVVVVVINCISNRQDRNKVNLLTKQNTTLRVAVRGYQWSPWAHRAGGLIFIIFYKSSYLVRWTLFWTVPRYPMKKYPS